MLLLTIWCALCFLSRWSWTINPYSCQNWKAWCCSTSAAGEGVVAPGSWARTTRSMPPPGQRTNFGFFLPSPTPQRPKLCPVSQCEEGSGGISCRACAVSSHAFRRIKPGSLGFLFVCVFFNCALTHPCSQGVVITIRLGARSQIGQIRIRGCNAKGICTVHKLESHGQIMRVLLSLIHI